MFILGSAVERTVVEKGEVNIHRPYSTSTDTSFGKSASLFAEMERIAASQFKRVGVSPSLWDAMIRVPPQTQRRLSKAELVSFGILGIDGSMGVDPAYQDAKDSTYYF